MVWPWYFCMVLKVGIKITVDWNALDNISKKVQSMIILRLPAVSKVTGLPRSTLYLYIKTNQFPRPIKLGVRSVGWIKEEIDEWLAKKIGMRL